MRAIAGRFGLAVSLVLSGAASAEERTYDAFKAMLGGSPDLTWVMLNCVQGIDPGQIFDGCTELVDRSDELVALEAELLAGETLTPDQEVEVKDLMKRGTTFQVLGYTVRAKAIRMLADNQCKVAQSIAEASKDSGLVRVAADCP